MLGLVVGWTVVIAGLLALELREYHLRVLDEARMEADLGWERDMAYRRWVQANGGVYVPVSDLSPPNENLAHVPERDVVTPSGRKLTLVNSSYMFRQVASLAGKKTAVSRTTSLKPLREVNAPNELEAAALRTFEHGAKEAVWFEESDGTPTMRVMRPFYVEAKCLKCHEQQGYKSGDVRGGITTTVRVATLGEQLAARRHSMIAYASLWAVGLVGIGAAWRSLRRRALLQQEAEQALRTSEEKFKEMAEQLPEGLFECDLTGRISYANPRILRDCGYTPEDVTRGLNMLDLVAEEDRERAKDDLARTAAGSPHQGREYTFLRKQGQRFPAVVYPAAILRDGHAVGVRGILVDITQQKQMEEELVRAAQVDKLTGLANRASLLDRLQRAVERARSGAGRFVVMFMDFDRFKVVNDSLGHMVGDELLVAMSRRLTGQIRRGMDTLAQVESETLAARLGGDEFVLLLEGFREVADAMSVAERVVEALAVPYEIGQHRIVSTASIGVVMGDGSYTQAEEVLRDADTAMYEAKVRGRGRAVLFDQSMQDRARRRMEIETDLRGALDGGQLELYYQPIVSLETGTAHSYEALARWKHPRQGWISPAEFIPVAEDCGLILPLGEWAFTQACRQMAAWRKELGRDAVPAVSVNLSRRQVVMPELPGQLRRITATAGLEPGAIMLEITESAVMDDVATASRVIRQIKELGFQVALDDFGMGYSSLGSLHLFPIDVLKIDRSFVANLERGRDYAALVHTITGLARNLGMRVVAEGVDTEAKLTMLQALECQYAQGFLLARPMPAHQVASYRPPRIITAAGV